MSTGPSRADDRDDGLAASSPSDLRREFWLLVGLFNIALLGVGLGLLLLVFESGSDLAWPVLGLGLAAGGYGYGRYRRREREHSSDEETGRQD
jgi:hypothetical protein